MTSDNDIVVTHVFDAPRDLVFKAFMDPDRIRRWWGPRDYTIIHCTIDPRPGGTFHYCMRSPEGTDFWGIATYRELVPGERIAFDDSFSDAEGNIVPAQHYGMTGNWPLKVPTTISLTEDAGRTTLTLRISRTPDNDAERELSKGGWVESFNRLNEYLSIR